MLRNRFLVVAACVAPALAFAPLGAAQTHVPLTQAVPTLTATGVSEIQIAPDIVTIAFAIMTERTGKESARTAMEDNSKRTWEVVQALKAARITDDEIETSRLTVQPKYDYSGAGGPPRIAGFNAENRIVVRTKRIEDAGAIIGAAVDAGANRVDGVQFGLENAESARREALAQAGASARADAEALAKGAGVRIGRALQINVDQPPMAPMPMMYARGRASMAAEAATPAPVEPGTVGIEARVTIVFELVGS